MSIVLEGSYRKDIDGIRAIAIIPVVLYHAGARGFSGGFIGVDIFFVLSGYLITGVLIRDLQSGRFSILEFYRRRILRIFPALFFMLFVVTIVSFLGLLPSEIMNYAYTLGTSAIFISNIQFYHVTDYFNSGGLAQPLLHTWSLAIEEQWYLLWPLILAVIGSARLGLMRMVTALIIVVSLLLSVWLLPIDQSATFYLLPTRAWELGLGAILAMTTSYPSNRLVREAISVIGLMMILVSVKTYTYYTPFPGLYAVPPTLGTMLLIWAGRGETYIGRLLSIRVMRFVGNISYSLYLWHWPVFILASIWLFLPHTVLSTAGQIAVSVILAVFSWWFIEMPFRRGTAWPTRRVLATGVAAIPVVLALAVASPFLMGLVTSFTPAQAALSNFIFFDGDKAYRRGECFKVGPRSSYDEAGCLARSGKHPSIMFFGDSFAAQLWPGLSRYRDRYDIMQLTATGCWGKAYAPAGRDACTKFMNHAIDKLIPAHAPDLLILMSNWTDAGVYDLEKTLSLDTMKKANAVLVGPMPKYSTELPRLLIAAERWGNPSLPQQALLSSDFELDRKMRAMAEATGTRYISMMDLLCPDRVCRTMATPVVPLQFDYAHLTAQGSQIVVDALLPKITQGMASR